MGFLSIPRASLKNIKGEHLATVTKPLLIVQGERDTFGRKEDVMGYPCSSSIERMFVPDGDHSFKPRKASGYTESDNRQFAVNCLLDFIECQGAKA